MESLEGCVGVDGSKSGWIAVWWGGSAFERQVYPGACALVGAHRQARVIAVDVPIGLSERDRRQADVEARRFVGGRRASSVFSSPVRGIIDATSQPDASRRHREIDGRGFGVQSFAILAKVRQWEEVLQVDAAARQQVREIHPEVSFAALNGGRGQGLAEPKKTLAGAEARVALLARVYGRDAVMALVRSVPARLAATDDVLDALVAVWTAGRLSAGTACSLPSPIVPDSTGLPAAIFY